MSFKQFTGDLHRGESGQDMLEYALVLAAILAAVVSGSNTLSGVISTELGNINTAITSIVIP